MPILDNRVCVSIRDNAKLQHVTFTCIILHHFFRGMQFTHLLSICRRLCAAVWREDSSAKASWLVKTCNFTFTRWCYCIVQKQSISSFIQCCVCSVRVVASSYLQAAFRKLPTPAGRMVPRQTCSPSFQEPLERFVHTRHVTTGVRRSPSNLPGNREDLRHPTSELYDFYIKKSTWIQKPPQETQEKHLTSCCSCQFDMLFIIFLSQAHPAQGARGAVVRSEDSRKHPESNESRRASSPKCCNIPPCQGLPVKIQSEDF